MFANFYVLIAVNVMRTIEDYLNAGGFTCGIGCVIPDDNPFQTMATYAIFLVIPYPFLHLFDYQKNFWGIAGGARRVLMENLMSKFLNYQESMRSEFSDSQFIHCMHDVPELVDSGYMRMFVLLNSVLMILMIVLYLTYLGVRLGQDIIFITLLINSISYSTILLIYLKLRQRTTRDAQAKQEEKEITLVDQFGECVTNYRLIGDYYRRPMVAKRIVDSIEAYNKAVGNVRSVRMNSEWVLNRTNASRP